MTENEKEDLKNIENLLTDALSHVAELLENDSERSPGSIGLIHAFQVGDVLVTTRDIKSKNGLVHIAEGSKAVYSGVNAEKPTHIDVIWIGRENAGKDNGKRWKADRFQRIEA